MKDYLKVKNKDHLVRDPSTNAIINVDIRGHEEYVENYKRSYNSQQKIKKMEDDLTSLKSDINEIKNLLRNLINGSK